MVDIQKKPGTSGNGQSAEATPAIRDRRNYSPAVGLKEYWYPALRDKEVKGKPVGLKIVGEDVVFFRGKDGNVAALWNVCPHRGGSLMHGDCHFEGTVSCPYHGWTFDGDGNVLAVLPEGPESKIPGKVKARKYPTITLKGVVFVWMGDGEPVPPEEDIPPEMFDDSCAILYAMENWNVNWRLMNENGGDAHAPYVHRNAARAILQPLPQVGPFSGRGKTFAGKSTVQAVDRSQPKAFRYDWLELGWRWPKHNYRGLVSWMAKWAMKRQRRSPRFATPPEWDHGHHLPSYTRINHSIYMHTRCAVPVTEDSLRNVYLKAMRPTGKLHELYIRLQWKLWGRWSQVTNFQIQDWNAVKGQRYDTREYLSSTDNEVVLWRRLIATSARGIEHPGAEEAAMETPSEQFSRELLDELGVKGEVE
jgi:phenylpropionate dioxygenase-like ring-hydroxylating dioxygenase large terminal subunit